MEFPAKELAKVETQMAPRRHGARVTQQAWKGHGGAAG